MTTKYCLLIEDDPDDQEFFLDALHSVSSTSACFAVSDGEEALNTLLNENLRLDYIFTDIDMPRMNGIEFITAVKKIEKFKRIPVIVYTAGFSPDQIEKVRLAGADAIYSKTRMNALKGILAKYFSP
jgi:CheY-like chemotaxis protein